MPRIARKESKSSFYHVMVQGINREYIFNTELNIKRYKELILEKIDREYVEILAYCIMNNHAHLLIYCEESEQLGKFMQKLNTSYSRFYNEINNRVGYVFRDRYLSQSIMCKKQLYNCVAYILNNPVKAGIVKNIGDYKYSSYYEVLNGRSIITNKGIRLLFGSEKDYKEQLVEICKKSIDMDFIDIKEKKKDINEFIIEIEKFYHKNINLIKEDRVVLKLVINKARIETDVTIVKLAELLGISKSTVGKYLKR